jgi:hypothetical protein
MLKSYITIITLSIIFSFNALQAGCGGCGPVKKVAAVNLLPKDILTVIPEDNMLNGKVEASCGMCNFAMKDSDCSLAIRVGENVYNVKGTGMEDHGDSHAKDGFCNSVRIANVKGKISKGNFKSESFALIGTK